LWAYCIYDLKLTDDQFERYTISQIKLLMERHKTHLREQEYLHALVCSTIANVNRGKGKAYKPDDFMRKERKVMSVDEMYESLKAITLMSGGEVHG
jgi:hypothetical protein